MLSCSPEKSAKSPVHQKDVETIHFFDTFSEKVNLSSFVDTIELIPLETTEENLIGEINRVIFKNGKYYIRSTNGMMNGKLLIFDEKGKYLWKLDRKGGGPEEYIELKDFAIMDNQDIVVTTYRKMLAYDSIGNFLYATKLGEICPKEILPTSTNEIVEFHFNPFLFAFIGILNQHICYVP